MTSLEPGREIAAVFGPADTTVTVMASTFTRDLLAAANFTWYAPAHHVRFGVQSDNYRFEHDVETIDIDEEFLRPFTSATALNTLAMYVEDTWQVTPTLNLRAGVRHLRAGTLGNATLPRAGLRWQITPSLQFNLGGGKYAQAMRSMKDDESVISSFVAYDLLTTQPESVGLLRGSDMD